MIPRYLIVEINLIVVPSHRNIPPIGIFLNISGGTKQNNLSFFCIKLEKILAHPLLN